MEMDRFSLADLRRLLAHETPPCVSIYLPTSRAGRAVQEAPIRCKNLLKRALDDLVRLDLRRPEAAKLLAPIDERLTDLDFWNHQSKGLAMFVAPGTFASYRLPVEWDEQVVVGPRFHVHPLLEVFKAGGRFLLLAVSQNRVRLYEGSRYTIGEVEHGQLPRSLAEALDIDEYESAVQYHSIPPTGIGGPGAQAIFHGHGGAGEDVHKKTELLQFFQRLGDALGEMLNGQATPLVFAGVEYLFPIFRQGSRYRYLVETPLPGNPDLARPDHLHAAAWKVVEPIFRRDEQQAIQRYQRAAGKDGCRDDIEDVIEDARLKRVETLLVARGRHCWGRVDRATGAIERHEAPTAGGEDLVDVAVAEVLASGGRVFVIEPEQMPTDASVGAVLHPWAVTSASA